MPSTRLERLGTKVHTSVPWRKAFPDREVRRTVQGVELVMPWSHPLPDYARSRPTYGQNLVELAGGLAEAGGAGTDPLLLMDIGANIGDSTAQIVARTATKALCVEGDPYWAAYLRKNVAGLPAVIEEVLLTPSDEPGEIVNPFRHGGTTMFVEGAAAEGSLPPMSVDTLRDTHPEFADLRLVKSDTDGWDPLLVPAVAKAWSASRPVFFFEFDPGMARDTGMADPNVMWAQLADLGYGPAIIWDNGADPLGASTVQECAAHAATIEPYPVHLGYHFWDVAVCHVDDAAARTVFDRLVPMPFDPRGVLRD